ncbi:MAG: 50S ribosomal protein L9 [Rhodobacterales bacterium]|nr:50S ribosomal protein L9 [Rhodobacterales bacterium]
MQVILLERIEKLGQMGDVVSVKPGYARNFLLPQKKALRATDENRKHFDTQRAQLEAANLERRSEAEAVAAKMTDVVVTLVRQAGEAGQLYGSVNARDVAVAVTEAGYTVVRSQVALAQPIKTLGLHDVVVNLHPEVAVTVTANVARSMEEAEIQAQTGKALVGMEEEDEHEEEAAEEQAAAMFEHPEDAAELAEADLDAEAEAGDAADADDETAR